jgi:type I restriction enzyme R subunit
MTTDTSEKGLESLIVADMIAAGWLAGEAKNYDRDYCVDIAHLRAFLEATQPKLAAAFELAQDTPARRAFLARLEK